MASGLRPAFVPVNFSGVEGKVILHAKDRSPEGLAASLKDARETLAKIGIETVRAEPYDEGVVLIGPVVVLREIVRIASASGMPGKFVTEH